MKAIVVDDEVQSHEVLDNLLLNYHPDIKVVAHGYNVEEGVSLINKHQPELLFLDVEMPDGLGFDLLKRIGKPDFYIIFTTGFVKYAHTAIKFGALDYLLKPVDREELAEALRRAREKRTEQISPEQINIVLETLQNFQEKKLPSRLGISTNEGIIFRKVSEIIRLEAEANYTHFFLAGEHKKIIASINLGEYAEQFEPYPEFMRVHRSHLINLNFVDRYVRGDGGYLVMKNGAQVIVSRKYRDELLERLQNL